MTIVTLCILLWQAVRKKTDLAHQIQHFISVLKSLAEWARKKMGAMDCKWQTAEAAVTASLKYATEDIAALAALRWKWQGQQLPRNGRLVWAESEMTWISTHSLICSQSKNVFETVSAVTAVRLHFSGLSVPGWCSISIEKSLCFYRLLQLPPQPASVTQRTQWNPVKIFMQGIFSPSACYHQLPRADSNISTYFPHSVPNCLHIKKKKKFIILIYYCTLIILLLF